MPPSHEEAERRFRELLETGGIAPPDEVIHQPDEILFLWSGTKTAVVLELSPTPR
jgi:hypothetical protein